MMELGILRMKIFILKKGENQKGNWGKSKKGGMN
jgi:hypothetical protein